VFRTLSFIANTQRYHGVGTWNDDGRNYDTATHVNDLAKFITSLNIGPVHLIGRSGRARLLLITALKNPALIRTLTLHEPSLLSVLPAGSAEEKPAREDVARYTAAAVAANKTGNPSNSAAVL
jgi:pimeloyl-ACP methyl ester carboxylesterase